MNIVIHMLKHVGIDMIHRIRYVILPHRSFLTLTPAVKPVELEPAFSLLLQKQMRDYIRMRQSFQWHLPELRMEDDFGITWYQNQYKWWRPGDLDLDPEFSLDTITYLRREECVESPLVYLKQGDPLAMPYPCFTLDS